MNEAVRFCAWAQLRSTWRWRVALVVLLGAVGAVAIGAAGGATRTSSAVDRFLIGQRAFDVAVFCGPLERDGDEFPCEQDLAAHDEILDTAPLVLLPALMFAGGQSIEVTDDTCYGGPGDVMLVVAPDGRFGTAINTRRFIEGSPADPARPDEITISRELARRTGLGVGDTIDVQLFAGGDCQEPERWDPARPLTVVGVEVSPFEIQPESGPYLSFALASAALLNDVGDLPDLELIVAGRLRPGSTIEDLSLPGVADNPDQPGAALPGTLNSDNLKRSTRAHVTGQWVIAGVVAAAGLILLGQVLNRQIRAGATESASLGQLGLTRGDLLAVGTVHLLSVVVPAALLGAIGGYLASALTPLGLARIIEVDRGLRVDPVVFGLGAVAMALGLLAVAIPSVVATAARRRARADPQVSGRAASLARQLGGGPVATTGLRMAFQPLRGPNAPPMRTGLGIIVAAVIMLVGATVFAGSLTHLLASKHLVGWNWDALVYVDNGDGEPVDADRLRAAAIEAPGVAAATPGTVFPPLRLLLGDERIEVQAVSFVGGPIGPTLVSGRAPRGADEIVLGRETMARLDAREGDQVPFVALTGEFEDVAEGRGTEVRGAVTIVGTGVLPAGGGANRLGTGSALDFEFFRSLVPDAQPDGVFVRLEPGARLDEVETSLVDTLGVDGVGSFTDEIISPELGDLGQVRNLPIAVAAMLALLAVGVVAQVIIGSTHARRVELGVLRALGMRRRQITTAIVVQALSICGAALIVGVPLGIALGRTVWRAFALSLGTKPEMSMAIVWLGALVVGLLLLAILLGLLCSVRPNRHLAAVLRRE